MTDKKQAEKIPTVVTVEQFEILFDRWSSSGLASYLSQYHPNGIKVVP